MGNNVAINRETATTTMGEILLETEGVLTESEDRYTALAGSIANLKGDYIDTLKVQIASEQEIVISA